MKLDRYYVQSEQVRGERRAWWVMERANSVQASVRDLPVAGGERSSAKAADRLCDKLNKAAKEDV